MTPVTLMLDAIQHGDPKAADEPLPLIYKELRRLAAHMMAREAPGQTLQPTPLVHEAWQRLVGDANQCPIRSSVVRFFSPLTHVGMRWNLKRRSF